MSQSGGRQSTRGRVREVLPGLFLGKWQSGRLNSITDVPGVLAHTISVQPDEDGQVNTGVTAILPRRDWLKYSSFAGIFSFNGCGEMTGAHWVNETGLLASPIIITATSSVGEGYRGVSEYFYDHTCSHNGDVVAFMLPLVAETYDGFLSDPARFAVTPKHVMECIGSASADAVPEGNTGGGTGMICHRWKGGTGSSSRKVRGYDADGRETTYAVGALVQANYGTKDTLRIGGVPVGHILEQQQGPEPVSTAQEARKDGSIIVILATDVPLLPIQLQRLAKRATVGLAKVGGYGHNNSGDIFLAFSTGNKVPVQVMPLNTDGSEVNPEYARARAVQMTDNDTINSIFEAAADAVEESIYNALFMAETMTGHKGRTVEALDLEKVKEIVEKRL